MARRELPEVNAGSMADIAFLLLIFFLVTTTMDTDSGLLRQLPPMPEEDVEEQQEDIKERNIFVVLVNKDNQLLVENEFIQINQLREKAKEFIQNPNNRSDLPEKILKNFDLVGDMFITEYHVISLQNDRGTDYGMYLAVQNELTAAYNELREEFCQTQFNKDYNNLDIKNNEEDKKIKEVVDQIYYPKISEAEPKSIGG